ncbi:MAG: hypothetical protein HGA47_06285 [Zoogloea sp.]|nr:hypothetical protein [Zoogloea sp.]
MNVLIQRPLPSLVIEMSTGNGISAGLPMVPTLWACHSPCMSCAYTQMLEVSAVVVTAQLSPLFLAQDDSTHILTKGDNWVSKLKRLKRQNQLPDHVLFALSGPQPEAERRYRAFQEIRAELAGQGVEVLQASNDEGILAFAGSAK